MESIKVDLDKDGYYIHVGVGVGGRVGELIRREGIDRRALLVTSPTVRRFYGGRVVGSLTEAGLEVVVVEVPAGEQSKNFRWLKRLYDLMIKERLDRSSAVIALGGGVVGDLAGFAAATYLRGIGFVQIPTTLLAQVDSSVGGKVGINHPRGKNLIGVFYHPKVVLIDPSFLLTLPPRDLRAGLGEVIKYGSVAAQKFFEFLEDNIGKILDFDLEILHRVVSSSCRIKAAIVGQDSYDVGVQTILHYGHTIGHAVESLTRYGVYRHGEAIAIGMASAAAIAVEVGVCSPGEAFRQIELLKLAGLPTEIRGLSVEAILSRLRFDKKVVDGKVRFVLTTRLGSATIKDDIPQRSIRAVLKRRWVPFEEQAPVKWV